MVLQLVQTDKALFFDVSIIIIRAKGNYFLS